jgi:hypothetical protein
VEADSDGYELHGVMVSNFCLPSYFYGGSAPWDYRGLLTGPVPTLRPGGYLSYIQNGRWGQIFGASRDRREPGKIGGSGRIKRMMARAAR